MTNRACVSLMTLDPLKTLYPTKKNVQTTAQKKGPFAGALRIFPFATITWQR